MAQRVCLIPWHPRHVSVLRALMTGDAAQQAQARDAVLPAARRRHLLDRVSAAYAARLKQEEMAKAGLETLYFQATSLRPYVCCVTSPHLAVDLVDELSRAPSEAAAIRLFERQLLLLDGNMVSDTMPTFTEDKLERLWADVSCELDRAKELRQVAAAGHAFTEERPNRTQLAEGVFEVSMTQTEAYTLPAEQVPAQYGFCVGWALGRICALTTPAWWQGRDIWLGLLCAEGNQPGRPDNVRRLAREVWELCRPVSELISDLGIPGFERGLPAAVPTSTVSCHVPPENVGRLLALVTADRQTWLRFVAGGSGWPEEMLAGHPAIYEEACLWAMRHGCGLMEGDDLVERVF